MIQPFLQAPARGAGPASKLILCCVLFVLTNFRPLIGRKYECHIVIEVIEVDKLHEGKILSRPSTSTTISAVAGKNEKLKSELSCATLGPKLNLNRSTS